MSNKTINISNILKSIENNDLKELKKLINELNINIYKENILNICDIAIVSNPGDYNILEYLIKIGAFNILSKSETKLVLRTIGDSNFITKDRYQSFNFLKNEYDDMKVRMDDLKEKYKKLKTEHDSLHTEYNKINDSYKYLLKNSISNLGYNTMKEELFSQEEEINKLLEESLKNEKVINDLNNKNEILTSQNNKLKDQNNIFSITNNKLIQDNQILTKNAQESDEAFSTLLREKKRKRDIK